MNSMGRDRIQVVVHQLSGSALTRAEINRVVQELENAGVDTRERIPSHEDALVIFLTDNWTDHVQTGWARISIGSNCRTIIVSLGPCAWRDDQLWEALSRGATDVVEWMHESQPGATVSSKLRRWCEIDELCNSQLVLGHLVGQSPEWRAVLKSIVEVGRFTSLPVLILGESGTGKELVAQLIHTLDTRPDKAKLVLVDCATISPALSGSEFFGHEKGAFTGAYMKREGAFELANKGTLFLDEVGELPLLLQAELLRVIQERTFKRIGGNQWQQTEFRLICATNKDLKSEVECGRFRADLYYRIANWTFTLPPLRERRGDILPLAEHFIKTGCPKSPPILCAAVKNYLMNRDYVGNIRELKLLVSRILSRHVGEGQITIGAIPPEDRPRTDSSPPQIKLQCYQDMMAEAVRWALRIGCSLKDIGRTAESIAVEQVIESEKGNVPRAAQKLKVTPRALQFREARKRQFVSGASDGNLEEDAVGDEESEN